MPKDYDGLHAVHFYDLEPFLGLCSLVCSFHYLYKGHKKPPSSCCNNPDLAAIFPNAPYILTDLLHLGNRNWHAAPPWFDLIMLLSYAFAGLIYGFVSLQMIEEKIRENFGCKFAPAVSIALIYISAFGVYIGRFLRWNSCDIVG